MKKNIKKYFNKNRWNLRFNDEEWGISGCSLLFPLSLPHTHSFRLHGECINVERK